MKRIYWRPFTAPRPLVVLLAALAIAAMATVELCKVTVVQPHHEIKLKAASIAQQAMDVVKQARLERGYEIDPEFDPTDSGVVGDVMSPVTSTTGALSAKQTSVNPNFAAVLVDMLVKAGVQPGDRVAVGYSGSFPGFNIAVCGAIEALDLQPVVIASATSSQFGANLPDLMWIDMERLLYEEGVIHFRSCAASMGGFEDRAMRLSPDGRELVLSAIERNGLTLIHEDSFTGSLDRRMEIYHAQRGNVPFKAYINVGGGAVSVGRSLGKKLYKPGLNAKPPRGSLLVDSLLTRFMKEEIPVIHMVSANDLAAAYEMPISPTEPPRIGQGAAFTQQHYNRPLAGLMLALLLISLWLIIYTRVGVQLMKLFPSQASDDHNSLSEQEEAELGYELMV